MGTVVMMYVLPMLLGQTYDLGKEKPGVHIYPKNVEEKAVTLRQHFTDCQYRMIDNSADVKSFLSISGKLSLKIKSGMIDVSGEGSYLKDSSSKTNGIEILVKVHFETITKTIPGSFKPNADWDQVNENFLGTHYVRSIVYGGDLIASIRISSSNTFDLMRIKAAISGSINVKGGSFKGNLEGKLELLKQNAQDSSSMEINYYASVPIENVSYDIDGLVKLVENFPAQVKKVNNGHGNPIRMELYPLSSLKESMPAYLENRVLGDQLDDMDVQFDDLRETRKLIGAWNAGLPPVTTEKVEEKVKKFASKVNKIYGIYRKTIGELDMSKGAPTQPIKDAFAAYKDGDYILPQKYLRKFAQLQREIYAEHPELKPRVGGAEYIRWGQTNCSHPQAEPTVTGVLTTSLLINQGGSSEFICAPLDPTKVDPKDYFPDYSSDDEGENLLVTPIKYMGELKRFKGMHLKDIACTRCRVAIRTAVVVKVADHSCPSDKWTKEYDGYVMAPGEGGYKGENICVDKNMREPDGEVKFGSTDDEQLPEIQEVAVGCGSLPCKPYEADKPIPCVVCTI